MIDNLEASFDEAMLNIYRMAKIECNYNATYFLSMLHAYGGIGTAKKLLNDSKIHDGFTNLYFLGRLDLTMESVIWDNPKWHSLFTRQELAIVRMRLEDLDYFSKK